MTPRYEHDCERCHFLGRHKQYDLYYCDYGRDPTLLARYDSYGSSYLSGLHFATLCEPLAIALDLAKAQDLVPLKRRHA